MLVQLPAPCSGKITEVITEVLEPFITKPALAAGLVTRMGEISQGTIEEGLVSMFQKTPDFVVLCLKQFTKEVLTGQHLAHREETNLQALLALVVRFGVRELFDCFPQNILQELAMGANAANGEPKERVSKLVATLGLEQFWDALTDDQLLSAAVTNVPDALSDSPSRAELISTLNDEIHERGLREILKGSERDALEQLCEALGMEKSRTEEELLEAVVSTVRSHSKLRDNNGADDVTSSSALSSDSSSQAANGTLPEQEAPQPPPCTSTTIPLVPVDNEIDVRLDLLAHVRIRPKRVRTVRSTARQIRKVRRDDEIIFARDLLAEEEAEDDDEHSVSVKKTREDDKNEANPKEQDDLVAMFRIDEMGFVITSDEEDEEENVARATRSSLLAEKATTSTSASASAASTHHHPPPPSFAATKRHTRSTSRNSQKEEKESEEQEKNNEEKEDGDDAEGEREEDSSSSESIQRRYTELCKVNGIQRAFTLRPVLMTICSIADTVGLRFFSKIKQAAAEVLEEADSQDPSRVPLDERQLRECYLKQLKVNNWKVDMKNLVWDKRSRTLFHLKTLEARYRLVPYTSKEEQYAELHRLHSDNHKLEVRDALIYMYNNHHPYWKEWLEETYESLCRKCQICHSEQKAPDLSSSSLSLVQRLALSVAPPVHSRWHFFVHYLPSPGSPVSGFVLAIDRGSLFCFGDLLRTSDRSEVSDWLSFAMLRFTPPLVLLSPTAYLELAQEVCRAKKILVADGSAITGCVLQIFSTVRDLCQSRSTANSVAWVHLFSKLLQLSNSTPFHRLQWLTPYQTYFGKAMTADLMAELLEAYPSELQFLNQAKDSFLQVGRLLDDSSPVRLPAVDSRSSVLEVPTVSLPKHSSDEIRAKDEKPELHEPLPSVEVQALDDLL